MQAPAATDGEHLGIERERVSRVGLPTCVLRSIACLKPNRLYRTVTVSRAKPSTCVEQFYVELRPISYRCYFWKSMHSLEFLDILRYDDFLLRHASNVPPGGSVALKNRRVITFATKEECSRWDFV